MKSTKLFSIITVLILISSCSITKKVEKSIVGKWEITSLKTSDNESLNETNDEIYDVLSEGLLKDSYLEFNIDKTYELNLLGKKFNDSWSVSEDGSKILSSETDKYFKITDKTEETMVLKSINGTKKVIIKLKKI